MRRPRHPVDRDPGSAVVEWTTSETAAARIDWGLTADLGTAQAGGALGTTHTFTLSPLPECGRVYFKLTATDPNGNVTVDDLGGRLHQFNVWTMPGTVFRDGFEDSGNWTLEGEWQIGRPEGKGSPLTDPLAAYEGQQVLGHDLTGLGIYPGDYELYRTERATSRVIDASTLRNGELRFHRSLNADHRAPARIEVFHNGTWNVVWRSDSQTNQSEAPWSEQSVDIAQYADGNPQLRIQFKQTGSFAGTNRSGWNIDWLLVRDAQAPTYDACGGCGGAPSFGGVDGVADENPCAAGGVTVRWQAASAWGTGAAGTYAVYRSTDPAFAPSTATLLASGVAGTSWVDPASPAGTRVYYIVRAENNETCGGGPANGGVVDGNLVRVAARDELAQTAPGSVGSSLRVSEVNDAHVRLSWSVSPPAASYHVRRGDTPAGAFQLAGDVAQPLFEDRDEAGSALTRFYDVRAADACGNEGP